MSVTEVSDDLTTDSVPEPPRENISVNGHMKSDTKENRKEKKKETKEKKSSKPSKTSVNPNFQLPQVPAGSSTYNINGANNVHFGNVFHFNLPAPSPKTNSSSPMKKEKSMPKGVAKILQSTTPVTEDDLDIVACHVGSGWKTVGKKLGFSTGQLEQFEENCKQFNHEFKEVVYQMLLNWKQEKDTKATLGILGQCLWEARQYDAAEYLAKQRSK